MGERRRSATSPNSSTDMAASAAMEEEEEVGYLSQLKPNMASEAADGYFSHFRHLGREPQMASLFGKVPK